MPPNIKVWKIQNTKKTYGGVVACPYGFEDSPDAEILTPGFNEGKGSGSAGVSRQGNFLQWGYDAPPSEMTEVCRAFFLNCLCYVHEFDGIAPLIQCQTSSRMSSLELAEIYPRIKDSKDFKLYLDRMFGAILKRYQLDPQGLAKLLKDNYELIYMGKNNTKPSYAIYAIDADLKALGIPSNRRLSTLERLIGMLKDDKKAAMANLLLARYTDDPFKSPEEWAAWYEKNRARIYFTDTGGFKFKVAPEGYPVVPGRVGVEAPADESYRQAFPN